MSEKIFGKLILVTGALFLSSCAGAPAQPIQVVKSNDYTLSCDQLRSELFSIQQFTDELANKEDNKRKRNYALSAAGSLLLVPLLFIDLTESEREELRASRARHTHLYRVASNKECDGFSSTTPEQDLTTALNELTKLYEDGVITKEELMQKRAQLIEEFNL